MAKRTLQKAPPSEAFVKYKAKVTELARRINGLPQELADAIIRQYIRSFAFRRIELCQNRRIKVTFNGRSFRLRDNETPFESVVAGLLKKILDAAGEDSRDFRMALKDKIMGHAVSCVVRNSVVEVGYQDLPNFPRSSPSSRIGPLETKIKHVDLNLSIPIGPATPYYSDFFSTLVSIGTYLPNLKAQPLQVTVVEVVLARTLRNWYDTLLSHHLTKQRRAILKRIMEKLVQSLVELDGLSEKWFKFRHKYVVFENDGTIPGWAPNVYDEAVAQEGMKHLV